VSPALAAHSPLLTASSPLLPPIVGDKLRSELATTTAELKEARIMSYEMAKQGEELRLQLGGTKQHMAKTAAELESEAETTAAMKDRVNKLNANFMQTSESQALGNGGHAVQCMCEPVGTGT
jgi:hypothetical protein